METDSKKRLIIDWLVIISILVFIFGIMSISGKIEDIKHSAYKRGYEDALSEAENEKIEVWGKGYDDGRELFYIELTESADLLRIATDFYSAGRKSVDLAPLGKDDTAIFLDYLQGYKFRILDKTWCPIREEGAE